MRDHPEESLLREVDMIKDCQARMKNLLDRVNLQVWITSFTEVSMMNRRKSRQKTGNFRPPKIFVT